jgi:formylglycine-generating enzyme
MLAARAPSRDDMVAIPAGSFLMGSDHDYPEEAPAHRVEVAGFLIDRTPVTNAQFAAFVAATGHVTVAEIAPTREEYPQALDHMLYAGSLVFKRPRGPVDLRDWSRWWEFRRGADWRHPYGPESSIEGLDDHPVVHVAWADAAAYADWAGKALPTEAEFEYAARGGLEGQPYAWGAVFRPGGRHMANTWQGKFPLHNSREDGWEATSPVGSFPANGYGLYDMIGNVWEWTADWYADRHDPDAAAPRCCGGDERARRASADTLGVPRKVLKGGSFLCAPNHCRRYRPAARHAEAIDSSTCHIGFRCVVRP